MPKKTEDVEGDVAYFFGDDDDEDDLTTLSFSLFCNPRKSRRKMRTMKESVENSFFILKMKREKKGGRKKQSSSNLFNRIASQPNKCALDLRKINV